MGRYIIRLLTENNHTFLFLSILLKCIDNCSKIEYTRKLAMKLSYLLNLSDGKLHYNITTIQTSNGYRTM